MTPDSPEKHKHSMDTHESDPDHCVLCCHDRVLKAREEGRAEERGRSKALIGWIEDTRHYILECDCGGSAGYRKFGSPEYRCRDCRGGDLVEAYRQSEAETKGRV